MVDANQNLNRDDVVKELQGELQDEFFPLGENEAPVPSQGDANYFGMSRIPNASGARLLLLAARRKVGVAVSPHAGLPLH